MTGLGSFPFDVGQFELSSGETHDFRIGLGHVPEILDLDTDLYPFCYHSGGKWAVGKPVRLRDVMVDGWQPPDDGPSIFPILRVDVMYPPEKRGIWTTASMPGWENVSELPSFYPVKPGRPRRFRTWIRRLKRA